MSLRRVAFATVLALAATLARAQTTEVPFVPTPQNVVDAMLQIADVKKDDVLIDLGSGDGRIVITAAKKFGTRGFGVDIDPVNVANARAEAERVGVKERVTFSVGDLFKTDLSKASVVTLYLLPEVNLQLRPLLFRQLKPGSRVVSHDFDMGDWLPDGRVTLSVPEKSYGPLTSAVFFWVMPENAAGRWQWKMRVAGGNREFEVNIDQLYQQIELKPLVAGGPAKVLSPKLRNDQISFTLVRDFGLPQEVHFEFSGKVHGDTIRGRVRVIGERATGSRFENWEANRVQKGEIRYSAAGAGALARLSTIEGEGR
jgi:hypothetical protein